MNVKETPGVIRGHVTESRDQGSKERYGLHLKLENRFIRPQAARHVTNLNQSDVDLGLKNLCAFIKGTPPS
jgi:hypothetical protein